MPAPAPGSSSCRTKPFASARPARRLRSTHRRVPVVPPRSARLEHAPSRPPKCARLRTPATSGARAADHDSLRSLADRRLTEWRPRCSPKPSQRSRVPAWGRATRPVRGWRTPPMLPWSRWPSRSARTRGKRSSTGSAAWSPASPAGTGYRRATRLTSPRSRGFSSTATSAGCEILPVSALGSPGPPATSVCGSWQAASTKCLTAACTRRCERARGNDPLDAVSGHGTAGGRAERRPAPAREVAGSPHPARLGRAPLRPSHRNHGDSARERRPDA